MLERPDTWKKLSALSQASASDGSMAVKLQRTYHHNDEDETEVEWDNVAKGWCGVVWCGVVWCGVVWCGVVWCGVVWCGVVWCGVVWCAYSHPIPSIIVQDIGMVKVSFQYLKMMRRR